MTKEAISLNINGETVNLTIDPNTPLLWVLRDHLKLLGTKFGCGAGLCGACTVNMNGNAIRSCVMPVQYVQNAELRTIEGVSEEHPIKQAWIEHDVPQCGYCQPGQMMNAIGLLSNNAKPSADEITQAMAGNICRCGTYPKIFDAITDVVNKGYEVKGS